MISGERQSIPHFDQMKTEWYAKTINNIIIIIIIRKFITRTCSQALSMNRRLSYHSSLFQADAHTTQQVKQ